ncbi:hypothetical protein PR202_gb12726 [Eleusine coracana subsp. coracana]|uniref:Uncharacterized protein n=1 Tax=Eleusine coracana subsp. coracana TaxID=191504 RepID=A0AAV5EQ68_ELECO|nr:hypothetical protein PR202_gb12726 [Eleusine coracana subsp. coracana]
MRGRFYAGGSKEMKHDDNKASPTRSARHGGDGSTAAKRETRGRFYAGGSKAMKHGDDEASLAPSARLDGDGSASTKAMKHEAEASPV